MLLTQKGRISISLPLLAALVFSACLSGKSYAAEPADNNNPAPVTEAAPVSGDANEYLEAAAELPEGEPVWEYGWALAEMGEPALPRLREAAKSDNVTLTLTAGYALLRMGERRDGVLSLEAIAMNKEAPIERRTEAISALGVEGLDYAAHRLRAMLVDKSLPDRIMVEVAKSLWRLNRADAAHDKLLAMLDSKSLRARNEAALALASFAPTREAVKLLRTLVFKPGANGRKARDILTRRARMAIIEGEFAEVAPLLRKLSEYPALDLGTAETLLEVSNWAGVDQDTTRDQFAIRLLTEILHKIHDYYPPDVSGAEAERHRELKRLSSQQLANEAARSLVGAVDMFSAYLDEADLADMNQQLGGEYGGIGAWVGMRLIGGEERFTLLLPMYGEPAYDAGLKSMDWVEKIDDREIKDLTMREIIDLLKGKPGTKVKLLVWRRGWTEPQEFLVARRIITIPSVKGRMLPDKIGYIRLDRFGDENTADDLRNELEKLKSDGMKALVLDLSNNPGGLLQTAVEVGDLFLDRGKLVVSVYSKEDPDVQLRVHRRRDYHASHRGDESFPMAVLINDSSASASEIVAGALKDHHRATLVGQKSYGKGSVQSLFDVRATGGATRLKLTIAKYYLPNGECIDKKGIEPDIKVERERLTMERAKARLDVRDSMLLMDYMREMFPKNEKTFRELFVFDSLDLTKYPKVDELKSTLKEHGYTLEDEDLREELRRALMTYLESELGEEIAVDPQTNRSLMYAIVELRRKLGDRASSHPLYQWYEEEVKSKEAKEAARMADLPGFNKQD